MEPAVTFDLAWISGIIGVGLPLLISFVKRAEWSTKAKQAVAIAASAIAGTVAVGLQAGWAIDESFFQLALFSVVEIYTVASVTYQNFWDGTAIEAKLEDVGSSPDA